MGKYVVTIEGRYEGDLRVVARHGPSGRELATDAPLDNHGKGERFSPTDLVATALGTCICTILGIRAAARGLDLSSMRFSVTKEMVAEPRRRIGRLGATIHLPADLAPQDRRFLEEAARTCPVTASLHPDVVLDLRFEYGPGHPN